MKNSPWIPGPTKVTEVRQLTEPRYINRIRITHEVVFDVVRWPHASPPKEVFESTDAFVDWILSVADTPSPLPGPTRAPVCTGKRPPSAKVTGIECDDSECDVHGRGAIRRLHSSPR